MATARKKTNSGAGVWLYRLGMPPIFGAAAFLLVRVMRRYSFDVLPVQTLVSFALLYLGLLYAYVTFGKRGESAGVRASALVADGLTLLFLSGQMGAMPLFGWVGAGMIVLGIVFAASAMTPKQEQRFAQVNPNLFPEGLGRSEIKTIIGTIIFPAAFLEMSDDGVERIVAANEPFAAILGRVTDGLAGQKFADVFSPELESRTVKFADAEWVSHRTSKGRQTMFMLSPSLKEREPEHIGPADSAVIDPESGLYSQYYMNFKVEADVARCRRYKRLMSVIVMRAEYDEKNLVTPSDSARKTAFVALGRMLMMSLRKDDTAVRTGDEEVTIFMPETSQKGARTVVERMLDNVRKIAALEVPEIGQAHIKETAVTFFGDELVDLAQVLKDVEQAKPRMR